MVTLNKPHFLPAMLLLSLSGRTKKQENRTSWSDL